MQMETADILSIVPFYLTPFKPTFIFYSLRKHYKTPPFLYSLKTSENGLMMFPWGKESVGFSDIFKEYSKGTST